MSIETITLFRFGVYLVVYLRRLICMGKKMDIEIKLERKECGKNEDSEHAENAENDKDGDFESWGQFVDIEY